MLGSLEAAKMILRARRMGTKGCATHEIAPRVPLFFILGVNLRRPLRHMTNAARCTFLLDVLRRAADPNQMQGLRLEYKRKSLLKRVLLSIIDFTPAWRTGPEHLPLKTARCLRREPPSRGVARRRGRVGASFWSFLDSTTYPTRRAPFLSPAERMDASTYCGISQRCTHGALPILSSRGSAWSELVIDERTV